MQGMCLESTDATNPIISLSYPDLLGARVTGDGVLIYKEDSGGLMELALPPTSETTPDNISAHVYQLYSIIFIDRIVYVCKEVLDMQQSRT